VWGVSVRYDLGSDHPLVGRSVADFELTDGTRLNQHFRHARALLLDFGGSEHLRALADRYRDQVTYLPCNAKDLSGLHALFVRADGVVAWASDQPVAEINVARILSQWFDTVG
jgi:hypothetical protein